MAILALRFKLINLEFDINLHINIKISKIIKISNATEIIRGDKGVKQISQ